MLYQYDVDFPHGRFPAGELELPPPAHELRGPDAALDDLLEKPERERDDLAERLLVGTCNRMGPNGVSRHAPAGSLK